MDDKVNLREKLATFDEAFRPKIAGHYNDNKLMLAKVRGEFVWHSHPETDDLFLVVDGRLVIDLPDRSVELGPGELFVVPKGMQHRPRSEGEAHVLLIEPRGTPNTGDSTEREAAPEEEL